MVIIAATPTTDMTYNLGDQDQIPLGEGRLFLAGSTPVAVFRGRQGDLYATQAACPHQEGPLADSLIGGATLVCPLHNFRFNLNTGEPVGNDCTPLQVFSVSVNDAGEILLRV
jgi:nitrite reductase (NADH) small subunit